MGNSKLTGSEDKMIRAVSVVSCCSIRCLNKVMRHRKYLCKQLEEIDKGKNTYL